MEIPKLTIDERISSIPDESLSASERQDDAWYHSWSGGAQAARKKELDEYDAVRSVLGPILIDVIIDLIVTYMRSGTEIEGHFVRQIGRKGGDDDEFSSPKGITSDGRSLFVCDSDNHRLQVFDLKNLTYIKSIGAYGKHDGQFYSPGFIACSQDELFVTDNNQRIQVFTPEGKFKRKIDLGFVASGITVSNKQIFVTDALGEKLAEYSITGEKIRQLTKSLDAPEGICVYNDRLYVTDCGNHQVVVYDVKSLSLIESIGDLCFPYCVHATDSYLYIGDGLGRVVVHDLVTNKRVKTFGKVGKNEAEFGRMVCGLWIGRKLLYVSDSTNNRISVWE